MIKVVMRSLSILLLFLAALVAQAGDEHAEDKIKLELSYLALKLLDLSGEDTYVVESDAVAKPYVGICMDMKKEGILLTCVTPDSGAAKAGLKTGDLIKSINGLSLAKQDDKHNSKGNYWKIFGEMEIGDKLMVNVSRGDKELDIAVKVGSLSHPSYRLEIKK